MLDKKNIRMRFLMIFKGYNSLADTYPLKPKGEPDSEFSETILVQYFFNTWYQFKCRYHFSSRKLYYFPSEGKEEKILEEKLPTEMFLWKNCNF